MLVVVAHKISARLSLSLSDEWREAGSSFAPDNISNPLYIIPNTVPRHVEAMTPGGTHKQTKQKQKKTKFEQFVQVDP